MTATEILSELARRGVHLEVAGDKLRWRPKEAVTPELVEDLKRRKAEILDALRAPKPTVSARVRGKDAITQAAEADVCWHCHGEKACRCALCAVRGPALTWEKGQCGACLGSGFLCWPQRIQ
jgi:hypothetical protein